MEMETGTRGMIKVGVARLTVDGRLRHESLCLNVYHVGWAPAGRVTRARQTLRPSLHIAGHLLPRSPVVTRPPPAHQPPHVTPGPSPCLPWPGFLPGLRPCDAPPPRPLTYFPSSAPDHIRDITQHFSTFNYQQDLEKNQPVLRKKFTFEPRQKLHRGL